ncbi:MAG: MBL fold metallo-hydrolase, partial [Armatimonadetes bacterium]
DLAVARLEPGHGDPIDDAGAAINEYIDHRIERERQVLSAVLGGAGTIGGIVDVVYEGIPTGLRAAAVQQVAVQLKKLFDESAVWFEVGTAEERTEVRAR